MTTPREGSTYLEEAIRPWSHAGQPKKLRPLSVPFNDAEQAAMDHLRARLEERFGAEWVERFLAREPSKLLLLLERVE
jgi:LPS sulfotransferase NodH